MMNDIERYNFWNLETLPFEIKLWDEVQEKLNSSIMYGEERALVLLYMKLNDELKNPSNCDRFLRFIMTKEVSSDFIVHTLNGLSPIKDSLPSWGEFVIYSYHELVEKTGEKVAKMLMNVITDTTT